MTVKECYEQMGSDYEGVLGRMGSEAMIKRFALKFLQDPSFNNLKENLEKNDGEEAFRAAHTLKGVCLNLGFDELYEASAEITEKLRGKETAGITVYKQRYFCILHYRNNIVKLLQWHIFTFWYMPFLIFLRRTNIQQSCTSSLFIFLYPLINIRLF